MSIIHEFWRNHFREAAFQLRTECWAFFFLCLVLTGRNRRLPNVFLPYKHLLQSECACTSIMNKSREEDESRKRRKESTRTMWCHIVYVFPTHWWKVVQKYFSGSRLVFPSFFPTTSVGANKNSSLVLHVVLQCDSSSSRFCFSSVFSLKGGPGHPGERLLTFVPDSQTNAVFFFPGGCVEPRRGVEDCRGKMIELLFPVSCDAFKLPPK